MILGSLVLIALHGLPPVDLAGKGDCPAPGAVLVRLSEVAAPRDPQAATLRAYLTGLDHKIHVDLVDAGGVRVAEREIPRAGSCDELARAIALVIASWAAEVAEAAGDREPDRDPVQAQPRPAATQPKPTATAPPPAALTAGLATPAAAAPPGLRFFVTMGVLGSWAGGAFAEGAEVAATARRSTWLLGVRWALSASTERDQALAQGAARWSRVQMQLGPAGDLPLGPTRLELHVAVAAALDLVEGVGLATNLASHGTELGAAAGLRWVLPWGSAAPWLGLEGVAWPGHAHLLVVNIGPDGRTGELPRADIQVSLGLSLGR
jgi:hypothetical protein